MNFTIPLFKIVQRPLLPIAGSWVDAAPFLIFSVLFAVISFLIPRLPRRMLWIRHLSQLLASFIFIIFLHRCLCVMRGWVFALKTVGRNDIIAFGYLCMFALIVAFTLTVGRVFCGWLCPLGFFNEIIGWVAGRRAKLPQAVRRRSGLLMLSGICLLVVWLAFMVRPSTHFLSENVAAIWGLALLVLLFKALHREPDDLPVKRAKYVSLALWMFLSVVGIFVTSPWCTLFGDEVDYSSIVALFAVLSGGLVVSMAWCRYVCPMGAALGWLATFAPLRIANSTTCTKCGKCATMCPMGALDDGRIDQSSCIYCGKCVGTCGFKWERVTPDGDQASAWTQNEEPHP